MLYFDDPDVYRRIPFGGLRVLRFKTKRVVIGRWSLPRGNGFTERGLKDEVDNDDGSKDGSDHDNLNDSKDTTRDTHGTPPWIENGLPVVRTPPPPGGSTDTHCRDETTTWTTGAVTVAVETFVLATEEERENESENELENGL